MNENERVKAMLIDRNGKKIRNLEVSLDPGLLKVAMPKGSVIKIAEETYEGKENASGIYRVGEAALEIKDYYRGAKGVSWSYYVTIESPNAEDFFSAMRAMHALIGNNKEKTIIVVN